MITKRICVLPVQRTVLIIVLLFSLVDMGAECQTIKPDLKTSVPDSLMEKKHSPSKATIMSALLPGLGQVYNKKYWKVPIIYAGFGVLTYFIVTNAQEYNTFKGAYIESVDSIFNGKYADLVSKYTANDLLSGREYYRRNLEISCLLTAVLYVLNIVDASVDANLFTYNVSKDLTIKLDPLIPDQVHQRKLLTGFKLSIKF
ncbi:MAG: DUF5683 domain-containing protein [Bacteroidetes bacterium]|nr:DUF5683 domain-containing protein [Bacteroidota bacterium]